MNMDTINTMIVMLNHCVTDLNKINDLVIDTIHINNKGYCTSDLEFVCDDLDDAIEIRAIIKRSLERKLESLKIAIKNEMDNVE